MKFIKYVFYVGILASLFNTAMASDAHWPECPSKTSFNETQLLHYHIFKGEYFAELTPFRQNNRVWRGGVLSINADSMAMAKSEAINAIAHASSPIETTMDDGLSLYFVCEYPAATLRSPHAVLRVTTKADSVAIKRVG